jgi:hypothetical protein
MALYDETLIHSFERIYNEKRQWGSCNITFVSNGISMAGFLWNEFPATKYMIAKPDPLFPHYCHP